MDEREDNRTFRERITNGKFCYGAEVVTTRGIAASASPDKLVAFGEALLGDPRIDWISITDNPGGNPMLPPDWLGRELAKDKGRMVLHLTCKDLNRSGLESAAWKYASEGFANILAMTGDYPKTGFRGRPSPVFDLDSVGLITLLHDMNEGLEVPGRRGELVALPKTDFFIGCVVSPFKRFERELMPQYFKLLRKLSCGAHFVITQLGYDMRKFHEVRLWLGSHGIDVPVIGYVYLLNKVVAGMFHRGEIPGCVVSDELLALAKKYGAGEDKGRSFFRELAAKQLAVFKGLGFCGGYIGGPAKAETFFDVIDLAESFGENDWRDFAKEIQYGRPGEFYLYERDPETGLGDGSRPNRDYVRSLSHPVRSKDVTVGYRLSRRVHDWFFTPESGYFDLMRRIYSRWEAKPGLLSKATRALEKVSKFAMYGCQDCGDCSLPDCAYLCPGGACSKGARNGPCGGSNEGRCELDDKECLWARAYERLKYYHESEEMLGGPVVHYDATLQGTSSWANTFLGRDHFAAGQKERETKGDVSRGD